MKILLCGERSFAATGLLEKLTKNNFDVDCFSRGAVMRIGNRITGDVFGMRQNSYFSDTYDIVINFILIKNQSIEDNLKFIKELDSFCELKNVKRLIHISSISVYPNDLLYVNEKTDIESDYETKGRYASVKIAIDKYLLTKKSSYNVTFLRPGYIVCDDNNNLSFAGIGICLPLNFIVMLGNKKTSLPLIIRAKMHDFIVKLLTANSYNSVYLLLENKRGTKYQFLKARTARIIIPLPKFIILFLAYVAKRIAVISDSRLSQIRGLFKETYFDSSETEKELNFKFI